MASTLLSNGKCLVVSPHLDDAVLSCGQLIGQYPGTLVATIFTAAPAAAGPLTLWDAACGFSSAGQAMAQRRREDREALGILAAQPLWLGFSDSQYGASPPAAELATALDAVLREKAPATVCLPAGLFHSDHVLVHQAMLLARAGHGERHWLMYEDALYRRRRGVLQQRLTCLLEAGIKAVPLMLESGGAPWLKRKAVQCYKSQLRALSLTRYGYADAFEPERYWRLSESL
jgi:LmbE family N-acetylglucosaminyl deacetylase